MMSSIDAIVLLAAISATWAMTGVIWIIQFVHYPIFDSIERGDGSWVWDVEDNRYLDFFGGVLTTMVGHNNPAITAAIQEQAAKTLHTSSLYLSPPMLDLAEEIAATSGIADARVCFTTSGSEANDTAILLASSFRKSNQVLAMRNSYHGRSFTTQAITSHASWSSTSLSGLQVNFVQGGYRLRSPFAELDDDAIEKLSVQLELGEEIREQDWRGQARRLMEEGR